MEQDILNDYQQHAAAAQEQVTKYEKLTNNYSMQRLIAFGLLIFFLCLSVVADNIGVFIFGLVVVLIWFAWLVSQQNICDGLKKYYTDLKKVTENEIENILKHTSIYYNGSDFINEKHFYT